ncbi:MAG TPA: TraR/DksA C4-type zinc finger protein [Frankiaceae bacterium]|nr:TraR/DksA C4-type zinc finger protein [Frankiaceae bacterium]
MTLPSTHVTDLDEAWTPAELAGLRAQLVAEAGRLRDQMAAETAKLDGLDRGRDGAGDDQADAGAATQEREQGISLAYHARSLLDQAERALARLDAGTYGCCERCGRTIPKGRLLARPKVTLCVTCQRREARR